MQNYRSTLLQNKSLVDKQVLTEFSEGNYICTSMGPLVISSLGAIPKTNNKIWLIHDLSRPNGGVNQFNNSYNTLDLETEKITEKCFLSKVDLHNVYCSMPIDPRNYTYMGLIWELDNSKSRYFVDTKVPFGCKRACVICCELFG